MESGELIKAFGAFFAIMNPLVNLPIFLGLTEGFAPKQQRTLAFKIFVYSAVMCAVILLVGQQVIDFFGISISEFRIAGGAVLASIAWSMLNGRSVDSHHRTEQEKGSDDELSGLAFYPITFPMIVGPGTIATLIIYASHTSTALGLAAVAAIVAVVLLILFATLSFASTIGRVLSDTARVITSRLMGMILLALAVDMVAAGVRGVIAASGSS